MPRSWCGQLADFNGDSVADVVKLGERLGLHDVSDLMSRSTKRPVRLRSRRDITLDIYSYPHDEDVKLLTQEAAGDHYGIANMSGGALLDVGGHIGLTAMLYSLLHPAAHVYTFEPAPINFFYMAWNMVANKMPMDRIFMRNAGLSLTGASFTISFSPVGSMRATATEFGEYELQRGHTKAIRSETRVVEAAHLGRMLKKDCLGEVASIKLDCEGCEFNLVPAEEAFFADQRRAIFGEYHARHIIKLANRSLPPEALKRTWSTLCSRSDWRRLEWLSCSKAGGATSEPWLDDPAVVRRREGWQQQAREKNCAAARAAGRPMPESCADPSRLPGSTQGGRTSPHFRRDRA